MVKPYHNLTEGFRTFAVRLPSLSRILRNSQTVWANCAEFVEFAGICGGVWKILLVIFKSE